MYRIRDLREDHDLTQAALDRIADYFAVSVDDLLGRTEIQTPCPRKKRRKLKRRALARRFSAFRRIFLLNSTARNDRITECILSKNRGSCPFGGTVCKRQSTTFT